MSSVVVVGVAVAATIHFAAKSTEVGAAEESVLPRLSAELAPAELPRTAAARGTVPGWNTAPRTVLGAVLPEVGDAPDGSVSLRIDAPTADPGVVAAAAPVALTPGDEYTLTAMMRVQQEYPTATGVELVVGASRFEVPNLDAQWRSVQHTFIAESGTEATEVQFQLTAPVRGIGVDSVAIAGSDGVNIVANGSFESVAVPAGIVNDSLIFTTHTAALAVSLAQGPLSWTASSTSTEAKYHGTAEVAGVLSSVPLDGVPQGHYELSITDASGAEIRSGIAVLDADTFYVAQDTRFGVGSHVERVGFDGTGTMAASIGFAEVRNDVAWQLNEKEKGVYAWDPLYESEFARLHANGVQLLGLVAYGNTLYGSWRSPSTPEAVEAYGAYARAVADKFDVVGLEILNEFNHRDNGTTCGQDPSCYLPIVESARNHVRETHPDLPLVTGATALYDAEWFTKFWQLGGLELTDVVSYHPYEAWIQRNPELISTIVEQSTVEMQQHGGGTRPVWITELGFTTMQPGGVTPAEQGEMLVKTEALAFASGVEKYFYYDLVNDRSDPTDGEANFGLFEHDPRPNVSARSPKQAAFTQALMIAQLSGHAFSAEESTADSKVLKFGEAEDSVTIAWAPSGDSSMVVEAEVPLRVTSSAGSVVVIKPVEGVVTVPLTATPVFVSAEAEE